MQELEELSQIIINSTPFWVRNYSNKDEPVLRDGFENNNYQLPESLEGLTVVDIGAFIGGVAVLCAKRGAIVYCAEPSSDNFRILKKNIELNGLQARIQENKVALGKGPVRLLDINHTNRASNVLQGLSNTVTYLDETEEVKTQSLKEFFAENGIEKCDILKLDCEGAEIELIDDIVDLQIPMIVCELHTRESGSIFDEKLTMYDKIQLGRWDVKYILKNKQ
jgi:FkbM family methyltransferase